MLSVGCKPALRSAAYDDSEAGNTAEWGAGWARGGQQDSFLHKAAVNWTDKRMGLFLSRRRTDPGKESYEDNLPSWKDSEIMTEWGLMQQLPG